MGVLSMGQQLFSDQARNSASPGPNTVQWGSMRIGWEPTWLRCSVVGCFLCTMDDYKYSQVGQRIHSLLNRAAFVVPDREVMV